MLDNNTTDLSLATKELSDILNFSDSCKKTPKKRPEKKTHKKWYDHTCFEMSKRLKLVAKLCSASPKKTFLRSSLLKTTKEYKKTDQPEEKGWKNQYLKNWNLWKIKILKSTGTL